MEQFVKMLYDRLEGKKDLQLQLYLIMQNAINEMHNNGIISSLTGEAASAVHNPDPDVRVREKTKLAKAVGKTFIPQTMPVPSENALSYSANLNYDARFVNAITLCFQGGIEGLHMTFGHNPGVKLDKYIIQVTSGGNDLSALKKNIEQLDRMYDSIAIVLMHQGKVIYPQVQEPAQQTAPKPVTSKAPEAVQKPAPAKTDKGQNDKPGFFARLFGKKKLAQTNSAKPSETDPGKNMSVEERFYHEMQGKPAFRNAFSCATAEINSVIIKKQFQLKTPAGAPLTISAWQQLPEAEKLNHILSMGNYSIVPSAVLCVDFVEMLPYCIAITLLYFAYTGQKENQILDTGDGADNTMLKIAVESLNSCYPKWQCRMFSL